MLRSSKFPFFIGLALAVGFASLSGGQESAIDPALFIYTANEEDATEYVHRVVESGNSESLTVTLLALEKGLDAGAIEYDFLQLENNLQNLISITEGLIMEQKYSDNYSAEDLAKMMESASELKEECQESGHIASEEETEYTPPESDALYNEKKKDLLEAAYRILEKVSGVIDQRGLRAQEAQMEPVIASEADGEAMGPDGAMTGAPNENGEL